MTMPLLMLVVLIITFGVKFHGTSGSCSSFPMSLHDGRTIAGQEHNHAGIRNTLHAWWFTERRYQRQGDLLRYAC